MHVAVEDLNARMASEHLEHVLAAAQAVDPLGERVAVAYERWVMHHEHDRLVPEPWVVDAGLYRARRVGREHAARARDGLEARRVDRKERDLAAIDDLAGVGRARRRIPRQRPLERAAPSGCGRVRVVVARHERDRALGHVRVREDLRKVLELLRVTDLGEIAGDDDVIGAARLRGLEAPCELPRAVARVDGASQAHRPGRDAVAGARATVRGIERVDIREVSDTAGAA